MTRESVSSAVLLLHDADVAIAAGSGRNTDLGVAIVRIAPASALEETVRGRNLAEGGANGQVAARIDDAASALTHVYSLAARVFAGIRTSTGPDTVHKQDPRVVIVFQVIDIGLKPCRISDANAGFRASPER